MPAPPIAIYGAIARFNYGDLLFPLLLKRALEDAGCKRPLEAVGLRASDLSAYGALPTKAVRWLASPENLPDGSSVIVAGGEALAAGWGRMSSHLMPRWIADPMYPLVARMVSERRLNKLGQRRAGVPWVLPFCLRPEHFSNRVRVIYNAVGGSGLAESDPAWRAEVEAAIGQAAYASVRDRATREALGGAGSGADLYPDSAAAMAEHFPQDWLRHNARGDVRAILDGRPFLCFQLHRYFTREKLRQFARELDRVQREGGLRVVLLPIGRAAGHSDQVALARLRRAMSSPADLPVDLGVFDIMALLAHCTAYTGTSLHGMITAMAYARPYAIIGKNPKCLAFASEWAPEPFRAPARAKGFCETLSARVKHRGTSLLEESGRRIREQAGEGLRRVVEAAMA